MDVARSLDNVAIALPASIYLFAIIYRGMFDSRAQGQGTRANRRLHQRRVRPVPSASSRRVAIGLVASIYALDIIATLFLIPELKGKELELASTSATRL